MRNHSTTHNPAAKTPNKATAKRLNIGEFARTFAMGSRGLAAYRADLARKTASMRFIVAE